MLRRSRFSIASKNSRISRNRPTLIEPSGCLTLRPRPNLRVRKMELPSLPA